MADRIKHHAADDFSTLVSALKLALPMGYFDVRPL
jgi:hypothetical protein